jgi:hypothetical protein
MNLRITKNTISRGLPVAAGRIHQELFEAIRIVMEWKKLDVIGRTPMKTGALRDTIRVIGPTTSGKIIKCSIAAGSAAVAYAIIQHENLAYHHTVGRAKYLESVILESRATIAREVASQMRF